MDNSTFVHTTQQMQQTESACTSFFIQPIRWMAKDIVGEGIYDGKLHCDKCENRVGNFNWSGNYQT